MSYKLVLSIIPLVACLLPCTVAAQAFEIDVPSVVLQGVPYDVAVQSSDVLFDDASAARYALRINGQTYPVQYEQSGNTRQLVAENIVPTAEVQSIELLEAGRAVIQTTSRPIPGWLSILPPLLAIAVALVFKRVIPSLFLGIWVGAWIAAGGAMGWWTGLLATIEVYVLEALADADHAAIIIFSLMIGGMVGIISRSGGTQGIVNKITGWANTPRKGQLATGVLGLAIFFDDYANTLVVGNTMRPVTDRLRISREKLAYIVDSTAAPVACLAFVTTWIGYEVGIIGDAVAQIDGYSESAYSIFLGSILYSFYPILAILFVFSIANSRRDFGPMYQAELRARSTGKVYSETAKIDEASAEGKELAPKADKPQRAFNAIIPILVLVGAVLAGLYATGEGESLRDIIGSANSYTALMWGSLLGVLAAAGLAIGQRILNLEETVEAWYGGLKSMLFAMIILVLAWALSAITGVLHTADYLVTLVGQALHPGIVPALIFVLAAATAFATGSSWGTMGILMPLVVPLVWAVLEANGQASPEYYYIIYSTVSAVLAGSVWGDHCSPISDTTILSSMASGCDHIDHVRTQIPYALVVGAVALLLGTVPTGFGFPWWASLVLSIAVLAFGLRLFGSRVADELPSVSTEEEEAVAAP